MGIVRENFQDRKPSKKRAAALDTLGKLITCTGYAVDPLESYPTLLDLLFEKIETATQQERSKLLRLLGIIGAVDPYRYKTLHLERLENESAGGKGEKQKEKEVNYAPSPEQESPLKVCGLLYLLHLLHLSRLLCLPCLLRLDDEVPAGKGKNGATI